MPVLGGWVLPMGVSRGRQLKVVGVQGQAGCPYTVLASTPLLPEPDLLLPCSNELAEP